MNRSLWLVLGALCLLGAALRIVTFAALPNVAHPDETFQYLEQAYRVLTGRGLVPWEYAVGARSWVLAGLIMPAMKAGLALSADPAVRLWAVTLFMIAGSTAGIAAAFMLGLRAGGATHALFAGLLAAVWCELVYLSPHVLADTLAAVPLIAALAIGYRVPTPTAGRMVAAGILFGLAFIFRVQLAPAIAVAMLAICGRDIRGRYLPMAIGFAAPVLLMGVVDWAVLGAPFRSVLVYLRVNAGGVADTFGTSPPYTYALIELRLWSVATPVIIVTAALGARRLPLVAVVAAIILDTFFLVAHKEYRFIYPALPLIFTLCGVGTADILARLSPPTTPERPAGVLVALAAMAWLALDAVAGTSPVMTAKWSAQRGWLVGFGAVDADPAVCGLGIAPANLWFLTGRVRLRGDIPLYDGDAAAEQPDAYNALLVADPQVPVAEAIGPFHLAACVGATQKVCRYTRDGGCDASRGHPLEADPGADVRAVLERLGLSPR